MKPKLPRIRVDFCLTGKEFLLDDVTLRLGIPPTITRTKEEWPDVIKNAPEDWPENLKVRTVWALETGDEHCKAVCWQFEKIIEQLKGKEEIIQKLCNEYKLEASFTVVITMINGDGPEIVLTPEIVKFISSINAEVDFDMYVD